MKFTTFLVGLVVIGIVSSSVTLFKYMSSVNSHLHNSLPYNPKKINGKGEYQSIYGYTIIAEIDTELAKVSEEIEKFIQESSLAKSYSALPASSYHMTIYVIYTCGDRLIPPVERWVNATGRIISSQDWLPDEVLREQNTKAMCILEKYLNEPLYIKHASLDIGKKIIKLTLQVQEESLQRIRNAREKLAEVYEDPDLSMEPISDRLHITLAYLYTPMEKPDTEEFNQLRQLTRSFNGAKLLVPSVYLFDSMKQFIPLQNRSRMICD